MLMSVRSRSVLRLRISTGSISLGGKYFCHGNLSKSTLPPDRMTPTRRPLRSILRSHSRATGTAADGSMMILARSQMNFIASRIARFADRDDLLHMLLDDGKGQVAKRGQQAIGDRLWIFGGDDMPGLQGTIGIVGHFGFGGDHADARAKSLSRRWLCRSTVRRRRPAR